MGVLTRAFVISAVLAGVVLFSPDPLYPLQEKVDAQAQGRKALDASAQGQHEESYKIWAGLSALGPSTLGEEIYRFVRSQLYQEAYDKVKECGEDCSKALQWAEKGKIAGPPNYDKPADGFYPLLLMVEGVCYAKQEKYEQAYTQLVLARAELQKVPDEDMSEVMGQADRYLESVKAHVISEGDYITNKGLLQTWIGKVIDRHGNLLKVRITYANKELGSSFAKGGQAEIALDNCKELGAISADAAMKGWKE